MNSTDIQKAASLLVAARKSPDLETAVDAGALDFAPESIEDVYAIQQAVAALVGAVGAWKISAPTAEAVPVAAPIFATDVHASPVEIPAGSMRLIGIESELAFRLNKDLPRRERSYSQAEVSDAIDAMMPVIELVDTRLTDFNAAGDWWKLADNQINAGLVVGSPIKAWQDIDTKMLSVVQQVNGKTQVNATGWNFPGTPLHLLTRFANDVGDRCGGLKEGQIVTTGSMTGINFIDPGSVVSAAFDGLEEVRVHLPGN